MLVLDAEGRVEAEHVLADVPGYQTAAKSVAFDPLRNEIWVNTDLIPRDPEVATGFDARVLDRKGREQLRFEEPETQFMTFGSDGTGFFAESEGSQLWARIRRPAEAHAGPRAGRRVLLDAAYPGELDFVQEIQLAADGSALFTRWSGRLHRVWPDGRAEQMSLPPGGLYYTGVVRGERVCATRCQGVEVVCQRWRNEPAREPRSGAG